ncbi:MAG TPA: NAD-dependent epimerase/dehydratase family protein [Ktedonobacteraceae bacterium]|nr:NAD-dependent epimerase/dehydratase family protein [Ktedonobacteraceae bacterium]
MTILVTGATGFLGSALVTELLKQRQSVRILARDEGKARAQFGDAVDIVAGEITDEAQVQRAVDGAHVIYHLAGRLYHPGTPAQLYYRTHVEGTRILLDACKGTGKGQSQLQRIVLCSTTGVHGVTGETPAAEDAPFAPTNPYEESKLQGELLALKACEEEGLPVSVARPGLVYGPGDLHLLGFFSSIKKGLPCLIDGGKALIHPIYVDDMTTAFLLCAECPQATGHSYNFAGDHTVSFRELASAIAKALGKQLPAGDIPLWLANVASDVFALVPGMQGENVPLTRSRVKFLTNSRVYDIGRARTALGFAPGMPLEEGMQRTAEWYFKHKYL